MLVERFDLGGRPSGPAEVAALLRETVVSGSHGEIDDAVERIVAAVREEGDAAVLAYTRELDTAGADPRPLLVPAGELDDAIKQLPLEVVAGLQVAIANVALLAQAGVGEDISIELPQGQRIAVRELPVGAAAVYVPGGRAPYPSTAVMGVVTARAAGVVEVVVCSPPGPDGQIDSVILGTCRLLGVERVYRMGGAQAIAALACGTQTVGRVEVIVGPGNLYVQEAKRQLSGVVGIDSFAGPSDLLVVLGEDADPGLVALDMLAQAEHGSGSFVGAISPSPRALDALAGELEAAGRGEPRGGARGLRAGAEHRLPRGRADRQRVRPRAPAAHRCRGGGPCAAGALRRLPVRGRRRRHRVR